MDRAVPTPDEPAAPSAAPTSGGGSSAGGPAAIEMMPLEVGTDDATPSLGAGLPAPTPWMPVAPPDAPWNELRGLRGGELTIGWRVAFAVGWLAVFFGFAAIWKTSVELGLSTWWLGPAAQPQPLPVRLLPFAAPTAMVVGALSGWRFLPWAGLGAAAATAAIALGEFGEFPRFGGLELVLALAGALVSLGSIAGTYRRV